jgi:GT2 family glycosyltransferase
VLLTSSASACAVIPVKDGERYLEELLHALSLEGLDEILVIDSGSTDRSPEIARACGARVIEIDPEEFGHGATRNLGAEQTTAELICFLTQDATPLPGWLAAYREAFTLDPRVGAAYGPHLPRAQTSPMIARELTEFFAGFAPDGRPVVQGAEGPVFLSNVNAAYARGCWEELRFREIDYAEDQAFGKDMLAAGWTKVYHPAAAVLHAHDYGPAEFMRRYFDEYRGLRETTGHVEPLSPLGTIGAIRVGMRGDRRWLHDHGVTGVEHARWLARSGIHHGGRRVFAALGSRATSLPAPVERRLSLEGRTSGRRGSSQGPSARETPSTPSGLPRLPPSSSIAARHRQND